MFSHTVPPMNTYVVTSAPGIRQPRVSAASRSAVQATIMPSATNGTSGLSNFAETALNDRAGDRVAAPAQQPGQRRGERDEEDQADAGGGDHRPSQALTARQLVEDTA